MNDRNDLTVSDQLDFWSRHMVRPLGYAPPPAPKPAPGPEPEPDIRGMSMDAYAIYRQEHRIESSPFFGVRPWKRDSISERPN